MAKAKKIKAKKTKKPAKSKSRKQVVKKAAKKAVTKPKKKTRAPKAQKPAPREVSVMEALVEVEADITDLAQEMRDWADNLEEKFSATQKYDDVNSAADALEGINTPSGDEYSILSDIKITIQDPTPRRRGYSRADRTSQLTDILQSVQDELATIAVGPGDPKIAETAKSLLDEVDTMQTELESVEYPGMFG